MDSRAASNRQGGLVAFFGLTFLITWGLAAFLFLLPGPFGALFGKLTVSSPVFVVAAAAPAISAIILTFVRGGWSGLRSLLARIVQWRFGLQWYALVLIGLPLIGFIASRLAPAHPRYDLGTPALFLLALLREFVLGPLNEEPGWRGFALPRLLQRFNPFVASLVLGAIWGVWHLPSFFVSSLPQSGLAIPVFLFGDLCASVIICWLYLHTGGSVLIAVLFHLMLNFSMNAFGAALTPVVAILALCAVLVVVLDRRLGWFSSWSVGAAAARADSANLTRLINT